MAQLLNGQAKQVRNEQSIIRLATMCVPALKKLPSDTQHKLQRKMTCRMLTAGSTLRLGYGRRDDVFFIVMGEAVGIDSQLDSTVITSMNVGDTFCDYANVAEAQHPTSISMMTNCVVCAMHAEDYAQIVTMHESAAATAPWSLGDAMNGLSAWIQNALASNPQQRV